MAATGQPRASRAATKQQQNVSKISPFLAASTALEVRSRALQLKPAAVSLLFSCRTQSQKLSQKLSGSCLRSCSGSNPAGSFDGFHDQLNKQWAIDTCMQCVITVPVSVVWRLHRRVLNMWRLRLAYKKEEEDEGIEQERRLRGTVRFKYASGLALGWRWRCSYTI